MEEKKRKKERKKERKKDRRILEVVVASAGSSCIGLVQFLGT
jgi:hypothetical protein